MKFACRAVDAAGRIVDSCLNHGFCISNLKLQCLLYLAQAYFLVKSGGREACFPEAIQAESFGPAVPEAWQSYRGYGSLDIPRRQGGSAMPKKAAGLADAVVDHFGGWSALSLSELVMHQAPWRRAFDMHPGCRTITCQSMLEFFSEEVPDESGGAPMP